MRSPPERTPSPFLLVVLADDLAAHFQTRGGAFRLLLAVPGVESVTDLQFISQETLDAILLKPVPPDKPRTSRRVSV